MSMFQVTGKLMGTFTRAAGVGKNGEAYEAKSMIQILGSFPTPEGEERHDLVTMSVHDVRPFEVLKGQDVSIPVGAFQSKGAIIWFVPKGCRPSVVSPGMGRGPAAAE